MRHVQTPPPQTLRLLNPANFRGGGKSVGRLLKERNRPMTKPFV